MKQEDKPFEVQLIENFIKEELRKSNDRYNESTQDSNINYYLGMKHAYENILEYINY